MTIEQAIVKFNFITTVNKSNIVGYIRYIKLSVRYRLDYSNVYQVVYHTVYAIVYRMVYHIWFPWLLQEISPRNQG